MTVMEETTNQRRKTSGIIIYNILTANYLQLLVFSCLMVWHSQIWRSKQDKYAYQDGHVKLHFFLHKLSRFDVHLIFFWKILKINNQTQRTETPQKYSQWYAASTLLDSLKYIALFLRNQYVCKVSLSAITVICIILFLELQCTLIQQGGCWVLQ